jgi:hypothetical protein
MSRTTPATYSAVPTNYGELFYSIYPHSWAYIGIAIALGFSIAGAAWYYFL